MGVCMRRLIALLVLGICFIIGGCATPTPRPTIVNKPIDLGKMRIKLTRQYRCIHYKMCNRSVMIKPRMIVLHWTETATWRQAYDLFKAAKIEDRPYLKKYGQLNTSAQFLVARNGRIYQLMPSDWMARHTIGLNYMAIGIENAGGVDNKPDLTPAQVQSDVYLVRMLKKQYPSIEYLIGHFEYACFRNTPLWKERYKNYITPKADPGPQFMQAVRSEVANLDLKGCPS
jgi:N-acetyl-anhydromuramyl-L-alanine amidase AmpD